MHISWINCINSGLSANFTDKIHMCILTLLNMNMDLKKTIFFNFFWKKREIKISLNKKHIYKV